MADDERRSIELALIGAMVKDPDQIELVAARVRPGDFFGEGNARAFEHLVTLRQAGKPIRDLRYLWHSLTQADVLGDGYSQIAPDDMKSAVRDGLPASIMHYCDQIIALSMVSAQARIITEIGSELQARGANPIAIGQKAVAKLEAVASRATLSTKPLFEHSKNLVGKLRASSEAGAATTLGTGLASLDQYMGGLVAGELIFVAARPSAGKTSLVMQMLRHNAEKGRRCLFCSMEMTGEDLSRRELIREVESISSHQLRSGGEIDEHSLTQLQIKAIEHRRYALEIHQEKCNVQQVRALAKLMQATGGIELLAVDYLQIMAPVDRRKDSIERIRESAQGLKDIAKELEIPVVCLAQLNRKADTETPSMSHIKGCGDAEQEADAVILIHNPKPDEGSDDEIRKADLILAKGRNFTTGTISVQWSPPDTEFFDL